MTNKEKQKEMMVTIRTIIANTNGMRQMRDVINDARYIIESVETIYPDEEEDLHTEKIELPLGVKINEIFVKRDRTNYPDGLPLSVLRKKLSNEDIAKAKSQGFIKVLKGHRWIYELAK